MKKILSFIVAIFVLGLCAQAMAETAAQKAAHEKSERLKHCSTAVKNAHVIEKFHDAAMRACMAHQKPW